MSTRINVRFEPSGTEIAVSGPLTVSEIAHQAGLAFHLPCGGAGRCGKCRVSVLSGGLAEPTEREAEVLTPVELARGIRLACQATVTDDAIIELPPEGQVIGTKSLDGDLLRDVPLAPSVRQLPLRLTPPTLEDQRSDFARLVGALPSELQGLYGCPAVLRHLPQALRANGSEVVATVVGDRLVEVQASSTVPVTCGVAVDIGTTTVVVYLMDLLTGNALATHAAYNEQGRHGADVISRIEYANTCEGGLTELRDLVLQTINGAISEACAQAGCSYHDIFEAVVVGNTAMTHIFMGLEPRYLAQTPYVPVVSAAQPLRPEEARIRMHPRGLVTCLPVVAGFVGADTVGVMLATDILERGHPVLAVDIGTNGEIALWSGKELLVASCAAGPAFEGAQIEHGMRAGPGAIEHVRVNGGDLVVKTIGGGIPLGICGSGLFDAMAVALEVGAVGASGRFVEASAAEGLAPAILARLAGEGNERRLLLSSPEEGNPVYLSQKDVRQIQLAKGAVRAAVDVLLEQAGLKPEDLGEILLAGAFGNYISPWSAQRIGMLPPVPLERIKGVGNAAGAGAVLSLLSREELQRASTLAESSRHIELSMRPDFQSAFMETMMFE